MDPRSLVAVFGIREGMKIADFGSGAGHFIIQVAKAIGEKGVVTGIDVLDSALEVLRAKAKEEGLRNIDTVKSDLEVLGSSGLADNSQDLVLIINTLFQSNKKREIIAEAKRVLKPEARLVLIDWKKGTQGLGPPDELRIDPEEMRQSVINEDFDFLNPVITDSMHFGMVFKKK